MPTMHYSKHMLPLSLYQPSYTMTEPFPESVQLLFLQSSIYVTLQPLTRVYTWLIFIISAYATWNTEFLHFQYPLWLLCQLTELCHTFLFLIMSSETVMMYRPLVLTFEICSCIPLLYVQVCCMYNILHISCSFYCNQLLCVHMHCRQSNILWNTWDVMIFCDSLELFYFYIWLQHVQDYDIHNIQHYSLEEIIVYHFHS